MQENHMVVGAAQEYERQTRDVTSEDFEAAQAELEYGDYWMEHLPSELAAQAEAIALAVGNKVDDATLARMARYFIQLAKEQIVYGD